jgi:hypothetical protein
VASEAWQARNERARALGYESYYDYRAHDNGRIPPSEGRLRGDDLARARGHRGAADLQSSLEGGRVALVTMIGVDRDEGGKIVAIHVQTIDNSGRMRTWVVKGDAADPRRFVRRIGAVAGGGVDIRLVGSPRLRRSFGASSTVDVGGDDELSYEREER